MKTFKKIAVKTAIVLPLMLLLVAPLVVGAQGDIGTTPGDSPVSDIAGLETTIDRIVGFLQTLLFALAAVFVIIAGYQYMTAAGDGEKVGNAKNNLIYALIAVVLGVVATGIAGLVQSILGSA